MAERPRILITEDDELISRLYEQAFSFEGYDVDIASDGEEALTKITEQPPTLILLDLMMPNMDGLEVLDRLNENDATRGIPVIVLSNLAGSEDIKQALEKGAVKYMVKAEHKPKEIVKEVKQVLAGYTRYNLPPVT